MKATAWIGVMLVMLSGCATGEIRPVDGQFATGAPAPAASAPAARAVARPPAPPVYVVLTPVNGTGPAVAQAHLTLPAPVAPVAAAPADPAGAPAARSAPAMSPA